MSEYLGVPDMKIRGENLHTKCKRTPFEGIEIQDIVARVTLRGNVVYNRKNL